MKKFILFSITILFITTSLSAQTLATERLYQKYRGEKGVVSLWIPGALMKFAASVADLDYEEEALLRSIRSIRVLTIEDASRFPGVNFTREANINNPGNGYHVLVQVTDNGEDVLILGREKRGKLKDLLVLVGGEENVMVHIKGRLNADMMGSIAQVAGLNGIESLSQL